MHRGWLPLLVLALGAISSWPAAAADGTFVIYLQQAFPAQDTTNEQIEEINTTLGTDFDTWDDIVNVSLGGQVFWQVRPWIEVGAELDMGRGGIDGDEGVTLGGAPVRATFEQTYHAFVNALAAAHLRPCPSCERLRPFILAGVGVGYEKDVTRLRLRGEGLELDLRVDNDGYFPVATAGVGVDAHVLPGDWYLEAGVAYYWGRLDHRVRAVGELAPSPYVRADNDSSGPNYWLGVGRRF